MRKIITIPLVLILLAISIGYYSRLDNNKAAEIQAEIFDEGIVPAYVEKTNEPICTDTSLNVDSDVLKEVVRFCEGMFDGDGFLTLSILDDVQNGNKEIYTESAVTPQRTLAYEDLEIVDIDSDGTDEVFYNKSSWSGGGADNYVYAYIPLYKQTIYIHESIDVLTTSGDTSRKVTFSENIENFSSIFKQKLQNRLDVWIARPHTPGL